MPSQALDLFFLVGYEEIFTFWIVCQGMKVVGRKAVSVRVSGELKVEQESSGWMRQCLFNMRLAFGVLL